MSVLPRTLAIKMFAELNIDVNYPGAQSEEGNTQDHLVWMLHRIASEDVVGEKAHRWVGYAQALAVMLGLKPLSTWKTLNKENSVERGT